VCEVDRLVLAELVLLADGPSAPVRGVEVRLAWRAVDPAVVVVTADGVGSWCVARDQLVEALCGARPEPGVGVRMVAVDDGAFLEAVLPGPGRGRTWMRVEGDAVVGLLEESAAVLPLGAEWASERVEGAVAGWLRALFEEPGRRA
jgi:hypothetical protein